MTHVSAMTHVSSMTRASTMMHPSTMALDAPGHTRPMKTLWVVAVLFAVALHAGGFALAWTTMKTEDVDDSMGAPAMEIGLELQAPHQEQTDLPPGPEAEASAASTAAIEQKAKVEETELPKAQPTETDDPDRVVAPNAAKTPKEDSPTIQEAKANPTAESVASEATAPPSLEAAREAPRSVAPAQGSGESAIRIKTTWVKELGAHLKRFKRYPAGSFRASAQIVVVLSITLDRVGHVYAASIEKGSGNSAFDNEALAMMKRADPVPAPPPLVADQGLTFSLPVEFRNKNK